MGSLFFGGDELLDALGKSVRDICGSSFDTLCSFVAELLRTQIKGHPLSSARSFSGQIKSYIGSLGRGADQHTNQGVHPAPAVAELLRTQIKE